jgi:hypothetical protein
MIYGHEVVARMQSIREEDHPPLRKIRRLLRFRRDLSQSAARLATGCAILRGDGEDEGAERIESRMIELLEACEAVRETAAQVAAEARGRPQVSLM